MKAITFYSKARFLQKWIDTDEKSYCFKFDNHRYETSDEYEIELLRKNLITETHKPYYEIDEKKIIEAKEPKEVVIDGNVVKIDELKENFKQQKSVKSQKVVKGTRQNINAGDSVK